MIPPHYPTHTGANLSRRAALQLAERCLTPAYTAPALSARHPGGANPPGQFNVEEETT